MVREAEQFANEDRTRREEAESRNMADNLAYQAEKLISDNGDKIQPSDKEELEKQISAVKEALAGQDMAAVKNSAESLGQTVQRVGTGIHQAAQNQQQAAAGGAGPSGAQSGGDDVVDAEIVDEGDQS